jgi:glucose-1-phosphatase
VRFDHGITLRRIAAATGVPSEVLRPHLFGSLEREFDLGRMSADAFFRAAERAASLPPLDDAVWIEAWRDIFRPVPSALAALRRLAEDVTPVLISNTNAVHWDGVLRVAPELTRLVPLRALSFEVGAAKPEPALFDAALARVGARPNDTLYADDRPELVEAARAMGIDGFVVRDPDAFADELQRRGFLAPRPRVS